MIVLLMLFSLTAKSEALIRDTADWIYDAYPNAKLSQPIRTVETIRAHAVLNNLQFEFLLAVIAVESGFNVKAKSGHGALGLTQVMPRYHRDKIRGRSLHNADVAIEVGASILRDCLAGTFNKTKALKCYTGYQGRPLVKHVAKVTRIMRDFEQFRSERISTTLQLAENFY